jgi:hypothetical protein
VPNSVRRVISAGAVVDLPYGLFTTARLRHFGDVPLNEGNTLNAGETTLVNLGLGYQKDFYKIELDVFNLFNSKQYDIAYNYNYRTQADVRNGINDQGRNDIIFHPVEPRMVRVSATIRF